MKERPILFSGPMVRAILEGKKTQTRRPVKPQPPERENTSLPGYRGTFAKGGWNLDDPVGKRCFQKTCPYGQPGDRLWVRETWCLADGIRDVNNATGELLALRKVLYRADPLPFHLGNPAIKKDGELAWKPSIHMSRWASRIMLAVSGVRVERLLDICMDDIGSEGYEKNGTQYVQFLNSWTKIYGGGGCGSDNPWVWVVEFNRI